MYGVQLTGHGGPEMLRWNDAIPVPVPAPGEVLVRVAAAAINNTDINTRVGWYSKGDNDAADAGWTGTALGLPRIQGADVCGRIAAVGDGVPETRIGERVLVEPCLREVGGQVLPDPWYLGSEVDGGFAQFVTVAGRHAHRVDSALSDEELASFPCSYSTAMNLLTRSRVGPGDRVLVTGASGGVGSAAVQIAGTFGASVIAVTSPAKAATLRHLGAAETVARDANLVEGLGRDAVDVVIDLVGGPRWPELPEVLRPRGRYAVSGAIAGPVVALDLRTLYLKDQTLIGCTRLDDGVFAALVDLIERGAIRPLVAEMLPLDRIAEAQALFQEKRHVGKIVLRV
jgi:NADPH:quinone reductase-like Zn-dependent oxidoreductase